VGVTGDGRSLEERGEQLRRGVVRILGRGREVVGTGFFVAADLVATCAHVVHKALSDEGPVEGGGAYRDPAVGRGS
jgi:hypothetical protein